jgi:hypothetical protein
VCGGCGSVHTARDRGLISTKPQTSRYRPCKYDIIKFVVAFRIHQSFYVSVILARKMLEARTRSMTYRDVCCTHRRTAQQCTTWYFGMAVPNPMSRRSTNSRLPASFCGRIRNPATNEMVQLKQINNYVYVTVSADYHIPRHSVEAVRERKVASPCRAIWRGDAHATSQQ